MTDEQFNAIISRLDRIVELMEKQAKAATPPKWQGLGYEQNPDPIPVSDHNTETIILRGHPLRHLFASPVDMSRLDGKG